MSKERRLKRELRLLGLKPSEAAKEFGVSHQTINNWCTGRTTIPAGVISKLREFGIPDIAIRKPYEILTFK